MNKQIQMALETICTSLGSVVVVQMLRCCRPRVGGARCRCHLSVCVYVHTCSLLWSRWAWSSRQHSINDTPALRRSPGLCEGRCAPDLYHTCAVDLACHMLVNEIGTEVRSLFFPRVDGSTFRSMGVLVYSCAGLYPIGQVHCEPRRRAQKDESMKFQN